MKCPICEKRFNNLAGSRAHFKKSHPDRCMPVVRAAMILHYSASHPWGEVALAAWSYMPKRKGRKNSAARKKAMKVMAEAG